MTLGDANECFQLFYCCLQGKWDAVDVILACGAPVDGRGPGGKTPLILAAFHGETDIVLLLLSRGEQCFQKCLHEGGIAVE